MNRDYDFVMRPINGSDGTALIPLTDAGRTWLHAEGTRADWLDVPPLMVAGFKRLIERDGLTWREDDVIHLEAFPHRRVEALADMALDAELATGEAPCSVNDKRGDYR